MLLSGLLVAAGAGVRGQEPAPVPAPPPRIAGFRPGTQPLSKSYPQGYQIVFFSVLEGAFRDGLTDADVDQILRDPHPDTDWYEHFIQNCPICTATIQALQTYRARPLSRLKTGGKVAFGDGLAPELHARLYSDDIKERLSAIHDLEQSWVDRHIQSLRLNAEELVRTQEALKEARNDGIRIMQSFAEHGGLEHIAPGYHVGDECAVCNAANGMKLKLVPEHPARQEPAPEKPTP